ncbi:MAG: creatininase family protein [Thaumarchaeota archaeon]|nr:creatininase family protein [Nitrososphaerota archaeon]
MKAGSSQKGENKATNRHLGGLAAPQIGSMLTADSILCLPIGSFEQHGPHLPLNTDTIIAEGFTREIISKWGDSDDIWVVPTVPFGLSNEHAWSKGTMTLTMQIFADFVLTLCKNMKSAVPARNLLVINGHGGNRGILEGLVYEIKKETSLNVCVVHPSALSSVKSTSSLPEVHGGLSETSVMLALSPSEVYMNRLPRSYAPSLQSRDNIHRTILHRGTTWPWTSDDPSISSLGIIGDPRGANSDLGRRIVDSAVEECGRVISNLKKRRGG